MNRQIPVITFDGPSGSGKGTISQLLAQKLHWHFLDSGALYRVLAFAAAKANINENDITNLTKLASTLDISFKIDDISSVPSIFFGATDVTTLIRTEEYGNLASKIAIHQPVREALLQWQRDFRKTPGLVADGRDMGTVVFPDAIVKFFLSASLEERARRRYQQLKQQGMLTSLETIVEDLALRDVRDKEREIAPLKPAADAIIIDTTGIPVNSVFLKILDQVNIKKLEIRN